MRNSTHRGIVSRSFEYQNNKLFSLCDALDLTKGTFLLFVASICVWLYAEAAEARQKPDLSIAVAVGEGKSTPAQQPSDHLMKALVTKAMKDTDKDRNGDVVTLSWETIFSDGFEGLWYWTTYGYPTWRDTSYRSNTGSWSAWCADDGLSPPGPYASNMDAWMIYGPFDLSDADDARVTFWYWLDSESDYDYFWWFSSGDGTNFSGDRISGYFPYWQPKTFSLSNHLGDSSVWFAFNFDSDSSYQYEGAYVDDVVIEKRGCEPPDNDDCLDAIAIAEGVPYISSTVCATGVYESSCSLNDTVDVWHSYTPPTAGQVTISLSGSTFDTTLAVFDECDGTELACNDDIDFWGENYQSEITMNMTSAQTYLIRIAGYDGATGDYILTVTRSPCVLPDEPNSPSPANGANDLLVCTVLSWNGSWTSAFQADNKATISSSKGPIIPTVIYGPDDRLDEYEVNDLNILAVGDSMVALVYESDLIDNHDGTFSLPAETYAEWYLRTDQIGTGNPLCSDEPFRNQPVPAFCSGFLVAPDIIATAGHCAEDCPNMAAVFGFVMLDANTPVLTIDGSEIYYCSEVIEQQTHGSDWALIRLDREVAGHSPLSVRVAGVVPDGQPLLVIGHPVGLPRKYAGGATVRSNNPLSPHFQANVDTYVGNSGSPVFNADTLEVEGILVRGNVDWEPNGLCDSSNRCPDSGCPGWEDVTRTTEFTHLFPWVVHDVYFGTINPPTELIYSDIDVPMCDPTPEPNATLMPYTTYYWQVVAKNCCGETPGNAGNAWSFTTGPPPAVGDFEPDCDVDMDDLAVFVDQWLLAELSADVAPIEGGSFVDFLDWAVFANAWQSTPSSPNWNPKCDIAPEEGDDIVDLNDLAVFVDQWLQFGAYCADIAPAPEGDGVVNLLDFAVFAENWLEGTNP